MVYISSSLILKVVLYLIYIGVLLMPFLSLVYALGISLLLVSKVLLNLNSIVV